MDQPNGGLMRRSAMKMFSKKRAVQSTSSWFGPEAMSFRSTPYLGSHDWYLRYSLAYSSGVKFPPQPQLSLPTPQYCTLYGSGDPPAARTSAQVVLPAGELQYSTHWSKAYAFRLRTLAARYGSAPDSLQKRTNSSVPNWLG